MYRIDLAKEQNPQLTDEEYFRWREVWRAMLFFDTYVQHCLIPVVLQLTTAVGLQSYWAEQLRSPRRPVTTLGWRYQDPTIRKVRIGHSC
jgi:hypothetical protein